MFWFIIFILALYFIFSYPEFFFFLAAIIVFILIYKAYNKKQKPYSNSSIQDDEDISFNSRLNVETYDDDDDIDDDEYPLYDTTKVHAVNYHEFKVKGKNPKTNRLKTVKVVVKYGTSENIIAQKSGLLEPYTITPNTDSWTEREPSVAQIEYAQDLNIIFPSDCSSADISAMISKQLGQDYVDYINPELLEYAADNNICLSPYISNINGISSIIHSLRSEKRIAFFVYIVYCFTRRIHVTNMDHSVNKEIFYNFIDSFSEKKDEYCELIDNVSISYLFKNKKVDRRNRRMAQLYDNIVQYLENAKID